MDDSIFKAYDVRGTYPNQLNEAVAKRIAQAYATFLKPKTVVVSRDVRLSGPTLQKAVIEGLTESGVDVVDIGAIPTEMMYFTVGYFHYDGGIQVSASHNPVEWNGLKMIREGAQGISVDTGLIDIKELVTSDQVFSSDKKGEVQTRDIEEDYFDYLTQFVDFETIHPLKIVANNNFGLTGPLVKRFLKRLSVEQIEIVELNFQPDGTFPKGPPSPQLVENRAEVSTLITNEEADGGVSWDPDGDRFFVADEKGEFIQGCYLTAMFAEEILRDHPGEKVIYDASNVLLAEQVIKEAGGIPVIERIGHTLIKNRMKKEDAIFAGENSGHSYFREFFHADNGIIPFILLLNRLSSDDRPLSDVIKPYRERVSVSGELNFTVEDKERVMKEIESKYPDGEHDHLDGVAVRYPDWRFNLRSSNTEPLLRLNVEAKSVELCRQKTTELSDLIKAN